MDAASRSPSGPLVAFLLRRKWEKYRDSLFIFPPDDPEQTVIYGHVIHSLRSVTTHKQHATFTEHPALPELVHLAETVEMHSRTLTELVALPSLLEQLQQEMQAALAAHTEQHRTANSTPNTNSTESDKGAFVRRCLSETPSIRNTDIQRKAREQGITISPAYISEIRKAFLREQTA
jgi:hypothetical protein